MRNISDRSSLPEGNFVPHVIRTGHSAWCTAKADRIGFLVDGSAYFGLLAAMLEQAREQIFIVGWHFDPDIRLRPEDETSDTLGDFLRRLVDGKPDLKIRILVWAMGPVYSGKTFKMFRRQAWSSHPRIEVVLDWQHPVRGSHHQKFVCIDDDFAFVGGIDLAGKRWDTPDHSAGNPLRRTADGQDYEPVHDAQVALEGEVAHCVGALARRRWAWVTGETVPPAKAGESFVWPEDMPPSLSDCEVGLARTEPPIRGREGCDEALQLTLDALATARRHIYIESQYFASEKVGELLSRKLREPDGPEVVLIATRSSHGFLEKVFMGENRDRLIRRLRKSDLYGRLRTAYPVVPDSDGGEQEVIVHSKVIVVDDTFLRVGSSNLNQRSEKMDTELDVAMEGGSPEARRAITALRDRLFAEHLGVEPDYLSRMIETNGSLVLTFDALNVNERGLRAFEGIREDGRTDMVFGTGLIDPREPYWPIQAVTRPAYRFVRRYLASFWSRSVEPDPRANSLISSDSSPSGNGMKK